MHIRPRHAPLWTAVSLLVACGGGGGGGDDESNRLAGSLTIVGGDGGPVLEAEPNDSADQAHFLGDLRPGDGLTVIGHATDDGSDPFDGFEIHALERATFELELVPTDPGADFDLYVFDPISLQVVAAFANPGNSESGSFTAKGSFFLVLAPFSGESDYALSLTLAAPSAPLPETEPNDSAVQGQYLGELVAGDTLTVAGTLGGGDVSDQTLLAFPEGVDFSLSCAFDVGQDFDLKLYDVTADLSNPILGATFDTTNNPESGVVGVVPMTLIAVEVLPFGGSSGSYELTLSATSSLLPADGGPGLSSAPRGSELAEARRVRGLAAGASFTRPALEAVPGELLVRARSEQHEAALDELLARRRGATVARVPNGVRKVRFDLPEGLDPDQEARYTTALRASLAARAELAYAEPNLVLHAADVEPDDSFYNLQWHYPMINLPQAWELTLGSDDVIVAVIDTGSTPAQDLAAREIQGIDLISDPARAKDGDGIDGDPFDEGDSSGFQGSSFHGSHVAGTIAASTDNGYGVAGVTWFTRVFHVRVLGVGGGDLFDITNGILYAARLPNSSGTLPALQAHVMNMSLGGPGSSQAMQDAVTDARNAGTLVVAAAGNENSSGKFIPASLNGVVSVSAVDFEGKKAPYSNFHPTVDIAAPGGDVTSDENGDGHPDGVLSTKPDDTVDPTNYETFAFYQGTSMAAPHVAGVAALVLAADPSLSVPELEALLFATATDLGAPGRDDVFGHGLVDAFAAVQAAQSGGSGPPVLGFSSSSVLFDVAEDCTSVQVSNLGGGTLEVTDVVPSTDSGGDWLAATRIPIQGGSKSDTAAIDVCVDATGLAQGVYTGQVDVASNGGAGTIEVTLALVGGGGSGSFVVYVLAVDIDELATKAQKVLDSAQNLKYVFEDLPPGRYLIAAGTDADDDGFICDEGEPLCGIYPSFEEPSVLVVGEDTKAGGLNFPLFPSFGGASSDGHGFPLLAAPRDPSREERR